ncbi:hypothetical protein [uncultured Streptococcus sp.]|uniref:hypothetical protein n=1 Tax=uncultured Streptococcus sp. TaxID=83427 RepID=UPI002620F7FE|nr:hypothetical protein [uncultured Streptococcus sp.]
MAVCRSTSLTTSSRCYRPTNLRVVTLQVTLSAEALDSLRQSLWRTAYQPH